MWGHKVVTHGFTTDELHDMQKAFTDAAVRAQKAGYDGVQLHGCHGYLINQFISVNNNRRNDEYGGSPENRARFASEIISVIIGIIDNTKKKAICPGKIDISGFLMAFKICFIALFILFMK